MYAFYFDFFVTQMTMYVYSVPTPMTAYVYSLLISQLQDEHIEKNEDKLINVLQIKDIWLNDVISTLEARLQEENKARLKALARAKGKEKLKEKWKSMDTGDQGNYVPAQEVSHTRDNVRSLHKIIVKNWVTCSSLKKDVFDIVICNISLDSTTCHWDLPKLNQLMGFMNPNSRGKYHFNFSSTFFPVKH